MSEMVSENDLAEPTTQATPADSSSAHASNIGTPESPQAAPDDPEDESDIVAFRDAYRPLRSLSKPARLRVYRWLGDKLGLSAHIPSGADPSLWTSDASLAIQPNASHEVGPRGPSASRVNPPPPRPPQPNSAREFLKDKKPKNMSERAACLTHFLKHARSQERVTTAELNQLNEDRGLTKWSNPTAIVDNATRRDQYLAVGSDGSRSLTPRGESVVDALPDRDKVSQALEDHPLTVRRGRKKSAKAK